MNISSLECNLVTNNAIRKFTMNMCMLGFFCVDEEDLFDIKKALISVAAKWEDIGIGLGIKQGMLDEIEKAHPGGPSECFGKVLITWLRRSYNVKRFGEPTWQKLLQIVSDPAAGNNPALALRIAKNHLSGRKYDNCIVP